MDNLRQLMAAYFHQDWYDEYRGSWQSAVDDFARREPDRVGAAREEISQLLAKHPDERALHTALRELGNYCWPGDEPHAYARWLRDIDDRLRGNPL